MATSFEIRLVVDGAAAYLHLSGDIDLAVDAVLVARVQELFDEPAITRVVVDLAGVTFIDSTGIGTLIRCRQQADQLGRQFSVRAATGRVEELLGIAGVSGYLEGP
jgi:anti-anti-sigma factor